jgi:hypothetical protein
MADRIRKTDSYRGDFQSYTEAFKIYEDGRQRRYGMLFSVNGGAIAIAKAFSEPRPHTFLDSLTIPHVAAGMILLTLMLWWDLWTFAQRMRLDVGDTSGSVRTGMFSLTEKTTLCAICGLMVGGWLRVLM